MGGPDLAAAAHPLQAAGGHLHERSLPSLPSSPQHSPPHHHPGQHTPPHHQHHQHHQHPHLTPRNTYFQFQGHLPSDDPAPQIAQGQHPHPISHPNLLTLEELDWSTYPFQQQQQQDMDVSASWQRQQQHQHMGTMQSQHLQQDPHTNHHFPSTHPRSPPTHLNNNNNNHQPGPSRLRQQQQHPTLVNDLTQDQMEMMAAARVESPADHPTTNMAQSPALNPDGSPSWNSAMTQIQQMQGLEHFYRQVHDRPLHLASPHPHQPSPSSIAHLSQAHIISREAGAVGAEHSSYSQELHRQQQAQLRRQQRELEREEEEEAARRQEEEDEYLQNLVATFHPHPHHQHHPHHPHHQQQQQYFTLSEDHHSHRHYQMHPEQQPPPLHSPLVDQAYGAHHPQIQDHHRYLVGEREESPIMIKYGSPSLLHTPPLHLA